MNTRLQQFLAAENVTQAEFADTIGVARASVSHILAGRNKPGYEFLLGILKHYPDLNLEWLMSGKGKMYKVEDKTADESVRNEISDSPVSIQPSDAQIIAKTNTVAAQIPVKQRKAVKAVIFYDDGSFQELSV